MKKGQVHTIGNYVVAKIGTRLQSEPAQAFTDSYDPVGSPPDPPGKRCEQKMSELQWTIVWIVTRNVRASQRDHHRGAAQVQERKERAGRE
jgi:hypothetical protein